MPDAPAGLSVLVETERRLDAELAAARAEAARLTRHGVEEIERLERAFDAELAAAEERLVGRLRAEEARLLAGIDSTAAAEAGRWTATDAEVAAQAEWVAARIIGRDDPA